MNYVYSLVPTFFYLQDFDVFVHSVRSWRGTSVSNFILSFHMYYDNYPISTSEDLPVQTSLNTITP